MSHRGITSSVVDQKLDGDQMFALWQPTSTP